MSRAKVPILTLLVIIMSLNIFNSSAQLVAIDPRFIEWSPSNDFITLVNNESIYILSPNLEVVEVLQQNPFDPNAIGIDFFALSWSLDGRYIASSFLEIGNTNNRTHLVVWESENWTQILHFENQGAFGITWSPDSQYFSNGKQTFEVVTGILVGFSDLPSPNPPSLVAWSPVDNMLAGSGPSIFIDPFTYEVMTQNLFDVSPDFQPVFSPDGSRLAIISSNAVLVLNTTTFQVERSITLPNEPNLMDTLTWLSNTELAVALINNGTQVINPTIDEAPVLFQTNEHAFAWNPDGSQYITIRGSLLDDTGVLNVVERATGETAAQIAIGGYQATNHFELYDSAAAATIAPLSIGDTIDTNAFSPNAIINAKMSPEAVGSVVFDLNGTQTTVNTAPYTIPIPPVGTYSLTATPYTAADGGGTAGAPLTIDFTVID